MENHYALFAFYEDFKCLSRGELYVHVRLLQEGAAAPAQELFEKLSALAPLLQLAPEDFALKMGGGDVELREKLCRQIFDRLVVLRVTRPQEDGEEGPAAVWQKLAVDGRLEPMSRVVEGLKAEKRKRLRD